LSRWSQTPAALPAAICLARARPTASAAVPVCSRNGRVDDLAVAILAGDDVARGRAGIAEFNETAVVFTDGALPFELVELGKTLRHAGFHGAADLRRARRRWWQKTDRR